MFDIEVYLLESLGGKKLFKSGQKQPHQCLDRFVIRGAEVSGENILEHRKKKFINVTIKSQIWCKQEYVIKYKNLTKHVRPKPTWKKFLLSSGSRSRFWTRPMKCESDDSCRASLCKKKIFSFLNSRRSSTVQANTSLPQTIAAKATEMYTKVKLQIFPADCSLDPPPRSTEI